MQAKSYICDLNPYQPGLSAAQVARENGLHTHPVIKLASNENPLGASPRIAAAIERAVPGVHRYPEQHELMQALAAHHKVNSTQLVLGNGSNDILDLIARAYLGQRDEAISSRYAFAIYEIATHAVGAQSVVVADQHYGHDLEAMRAAITPRTRVIWLANPNNPTGTFVSYEQVKLFLEQIPDTILVVLDEAYYEYLKISDQEDTTKWLQEHANLILVRTFSKIYGLAGLRMGYGIASPKVIEFLQRIRQPFNGNSLALAAAVAALDDQAFVQKSYAANVKGRAQLLDGLRQYGVQCLPAYGNFVTFRVPNAGRVTQVLLQQGVIVRPLAGYGMHSWLRVTAGLPEENEQFLQALTTAIA
jgi:histidinol-phosphate aminotransferase